MSRNPKYIVTRTPGFALAGFEGRLWALAENQYARQKNITYYDHAADGKLEQLAAMAQEMNDALEPKAEAVQTEADKEDPEASVGIPTVEGSISPELRLEAIQTWINSVDAGKINLVTFKERVRAAVYSEDLIG